MNAERKAELMRLAASLDHSCRSHDALGELLIALGESEALAQAWECAADANLKLAEANAEVDEFLEASLAEARDSAAELRRALAESEARPHYRQIAGELDRALAERDEARADNERLTRERDDAQRVADTLSEGNAELILSNNAMRLDRDEALTEANLVGSVACGWAFDLGAHDEYAVGVEIEAVRP